MMAVTGRPPSYQLVDSSGSGEAPFDVWSSTTLSDPWWDAFLRSTPYGQFQQSSLWAEYKAWEGWQCQRVVVTSEVGIVGGLQLLYKRGRIGRIGYVSKGPVCLTDDESLVRLLVSRMTIEAKALGLSGLITQLPDESRVDVGLCEEFGFMPSNPVGVIEATYLIDISDPLDVVRARMHRSLRSNLRKALGKGAQVREGAEGDLPDFFELMANSCRRQGVVPSPPSLESIRCMWSIFSRTNEIHVSFAECAGSRPAAVLNLLFGDRTTLWKKGWDGTHRDWHSNELVEYHAIEKAHRQGHRICDLCSIDTAAAKDILRGEEPGRSLRTRDAFNLKFGGYPKLLPPAMVYIPSEALRWGYRRWGAPLLQSWRR